MGCQGFFRHDLPARLMSGLLLSSLSFTLLAQGGNARSQAISDMMWTMADIMGLVDSKRNVPMPGSFPGAQFLPGWNRMPGGSAMASMPMMGSMSNLVPQFGAPMDWMQQFNVPGQNSKLPYFGSPFPFVGQQANMYNFDGFWQGLNGEILTIQGNYFQLQADAQRANSGQVQVHGDWLVFYIPQTNSTLSYEYLRNSRVMVLRSTDGQVLIFHKIQQNPNPGYGSLSQPNGSGAGSNYWR